MAIALSVLHSVKQAIRMKKSVLLQNVLKMDDRFERLGCVMAGTKRKPDKLEGCTGAVGIF